jgi:spore coat polysaccharide biosynthesis protein SpsF
MTQHRSPRVVAIVQARMSSTRLPGKVLLPLAGAPVLGHVVSRLKHCSTLHNIIVATSVDVHDNVIAQWCNERGVACYRGSLHDVLDRYYQAAVHANADVVVRITADCPAIDPAIVDRVVGGFLSGQYDLYGLGGEFPDGLDCQVFGISALARAWQEAHLPSEREHVGPYVEKHPELFRVGALHHFRGLSHHRWTLDEPRDYEFLSQVFDRLYQPNTVFHAGDVLALLQREPALVCINQNITRNEGYIKSLAAEGSLHV